jgi:hypothetical protein
MAKQTPSLKSLGFESADQVVQPRTSLTLAVNALEKCGKTRFLLTCPKPIALINFDRDIEPAMLADLGVSPAEDLWIKTVEVDDTEAEDIWRKQWEDVKAAYRASLDMPQIATVCVDTADQMYELSRLANFGRLAKVPPFKYSVVNTELKLLIKEANRRGKNVIWTHRLKKEYKQNKKGEDSWSGLYVPSGWSAAQFELAASVKLYKDDDGYNLEVVSSGIRQTECEGEVLLNDDVNFAQLASLITGEPITEWM